MSYKAIRKVIVFLAVIPLALAASEVYRYWSIARSYREAGEHAKAGNYAAAFSLYRRISNLNSLSRKVTWAERDARIYEYVYKRQLVNLLDLIYDHARDGDRPIGVQFDRAEDYGYLGYALATLGASGEAAEMFKKAALLKPESPYATLVQEALPYTDNSWYDRLEKVIRDDPNIHTTMIDYEFGLFYQKRRMADEAIGRFERVINAPESKFKAEAYYRMGKLYEAMGSVERAIAEYEKALSQVPAHLEGLQSLSRLGLGYDEAIANLSPPRKLQANLGGAIEVLGYDIVSLDDGRTEIDIYLRCIGNVDKDYRILVSGYMKEESLPGKHRAKWTFVSFNYKFSKPSTLWRVGEVYKDVHIRYMRPGEYGLAFGIGAPAHEEIRLADVETGKREISIGFVKLGLPKKAG